KEKSRQHIKDSPREVGGSTEENNMGTSIDTIQHAIDRANDCRGVLLFYDIGRAKMNAEMAAEMTEANDVRVMEAPLVEGSYVAAVESGMDKDMEGIAAAVTKEFG